MLPRPCFLSVCVCGVGVCKWGILPRGILLPAIITWCLQIFFSSLRQRFADEYPRSELRPQSADHWHYVLKTSESSWSYLDAKHSQIFCLVLRAVWAWSKVAPSVYICKSAPLWAGMVFPVLMGDYKWQSVVFPLSLSSFSFGSSFLYPKRLHVNWFAELLYRKPTHRISYRSSRVGLRVRFYGEVLELCLWTEWNECCWIHILPMLLGDCVGNERPNSDMLHVVQEVLRARFAR